MGAVGVFENLLEVLLPQGSTVAVFDAYFDESRQEIGQPIVFGIAGYFIERSAAAEMRVAWRETLKKYEIPYFHMTDCAGTKPSTGCGNGVFSSMQLPERIALVTELIDHIKKHTLEGFSVVADEAEVRPPGGVDIYTEFVTQTVDSIAYFIKYIFNRDSKIAYFFESGHDDQERAYVRVASGVRNRGNSITFGDKEQEGMELLQAADLLAWHSVKYYKDKKAGKRKPRGDFLSLMQHRHAMFVVRQDNFEINRFIRLWPESRLPKSRRSALNTTELLPVSYLSGSPVPIIPVHKIIAYEAFDGLRVVYFEDVNGVRLGLEFDYPSDLAAMIDCSLVALGTFSDRPIRLDAKSIAVGDNEVESATVRMSDKSVIVFTKKN